MNTPGRMMGIVVGVLLAITCGFAEAKEIKIKGVGIFSGDFVVGPDTNSDGIPSVTGEQEVEEMKSGELFLNEFSSEVSLPNSSTLPVPVSCPSGKLAFPYLYNEVVTTHQASGDQLFSHYTAAVLCLNPNTGVFTFEGTAVFDGGTGQFAGASGSYTARSKGILFPDFSGTQSGTFKGTLVLP
ncbi:MAG: hypothetical protein ACRERD_23855 [Candidatus Binatia bacterium]